MRRLKPRLAIMPVLVFVKGAKLVLEEKAMRAPLILLENGLAIKLPEAVSKVFARGQTEVEVEQVGQTLVVSVAKHPRAGWAEALAAHPPSPSEPLLMGDFPNDFDLTEPDW